MNKTAIIKTLLISILFAACKNSSKVNTNVSTKVNIPEKEHTTTKPKTDSTDIRKFAKSILENKVHPSDDTATFNCIKQMFTKNKEDLEFYFEVFKVIIKKSDGALSEAIGLEIINFIKFNPDFFIEKYAKLEPNERKNFINHLAFEFYFSEPKHNEEIDSFFKDIESKLIKSTEPKRKYLNSLKELVKIETQKIVNQ